MPRRPRTSVYIATSVDGFIARPDGGLDWLEHDAGGDDYGYAEFMGTVDALLMGRGTFEVVSGMGEWPYAAPVTVLSTTLSASDVPDALRERARVHPGPLRPALEALASDGAEHVYLDGGRLIQSALREGLVDRMILFRIPILIGEGVPLFGALGGDVRLHLEEHATYPSGVTRAVYAPMT